MLIIIDTNIVDCVFDTKHSRHSNFEPVNKCITNINYPGIMVYGGSKFIRELGGRLDKKYKKLLIQLRNVGSLRELDKALIDKTEKDLKKIEPCKGFDDEHIIACVIVSGSKLVITDDKRADKYIKDENNQFYHSPKMKPKIYRYREKHLNLLKDCF